MLFYAIFGFVFYSELGSSGAAYAFTPATTLCIIYLLFPVHKLAGLCKRSEVQIFDEFYSQDEYLYEKQALDFFDDYDRSNPTTTNEGWDYYFTLLLK